MANIGVAKASYYADLSVSKHAKESVKATERIAQTRTKISVGDQVSFSTMEDKLRLDIAAKSGAIRSMASAQAYLAATMNALESGEFILKQLHDIAVLASDDTKTSEELSALDTGAENLADEFHKLMTSAQYKGKLVFTETTSDMQVKAGLGQSAIDIGIGEIKYDDLYDHTNPALNSLSAGITYEIIEPLTDEQKETILARTSGLNSQQLQVGDQFTVISQSENEDGRGLHTNDLYYADDDGSVPFDATSKVSHASNFLGGYLDVEIDNNGEVSDNFDIISGDGSAGTITFNSETGIVSYVDPVVGAIEIGEIDSAESEEGNTPRNGQNGEPLRINFYPDATIPGTSDLANGNFSGGSTNWNVYNDRVDFGSTFTVNGVEIPTPSEAKMAEATLVVSELGENDPGFTSPPANDDAVVEETSAPSFTVLTEGDDIDGAYLSLDTGSFNFAADRTMNFELAGFANVRTMEFELEDFANVRTMEFELEDFANVRTMEFELQDFANNTDTFSANLTIDFGSWTENGGTYTFSDSDPVSSTNLNFTDKTVSEVVDLLDGVSGLTAELLDVNGDGSSYAIRITSESTGFENGFRISGSGAATDERWTTPSVPTGHTYSNDFTRLASDTFSANLTIDFGSWTESSGTYTFSDSDPVSSTNLNFTDKTVSEVVNLLDGVSGLTAELISNADNSAHTVRITSENTGFRNGFRISGSGAATDERWTTPSVPTGHTYSNDFTRLASEMFSANLTIDFGEWTESGGTYSFSDSSSTPSTSLNFNNKTVSEVVDLLDGVSGLTAELISNADNSAHTVRITSENTGFRNGFRISGSGAATDERWTTPSVPTEHTYSNDFTRLASDTFSANLAIDFGSWTESGGTYTFSDSDPASSASLNFNNKTLSEVIDLIEDVSGLTARLVSNPDNPSLTVQVRSEETGFQKGFRISGSGAATDERWTTPSVPTGHTYSNDFTQLAEDFHGSGVLHGPAMVSDEFEAQKGDILKLRYKAEGDDDWYHVASYIVDSSDNITMALNEWGKTTDGWQNLSVEVPKDDDNYRFVFVNGTWDQSNGRAAGALMYIDDVRAEDPYETQDSAVQQLMRSINYSSSSNDQEYVKNVLITANDGSTSISDTSRIFNTEYDEKIMVAPTLNLVNPVSLGASNTLGTDGSTDHSVVVSKIEEVQSRIETARSVAKAQYTVLESAIENATDMRAQFFWGADAISDPDFFADTAYFTKQQIMQDQAAAILAQANKSQGGLMKLVDT